MCNHRCQNGQTKEIRKERQGNAHTKDRSEVKGGGRKPWRQKGTGRARHGSIRSPLWVGGGVTFGPSKLRNWSQKVNKKMKKKALFMCLSDRVKDKQMVLLDKLELKEAKTKELNKIVEKLMNKLYKKKKAAKKDDKEKKDEKKKEVKVKMSVLVVGGKNVAELARAGRNIKGLKVLGADSLNVIDILSHKYIVIAEESLKSIEKTYLK